MNKSVHKHVHCRQTTKFRAHEIKWFHSKLFSDNTSDKESDRALFFIEQMSTMTSESSMLK